MQNFTLSLQITKTNLCVYETIKFIIYNLLRSYTWRSEYQNHVLVPTVVGDQYPVVGAAILNWELKTLELVKPPFTPIG